MADDRLCAQVRINFIMGIDFILHLVLYEEMGIARFSAIMEDSTNAHQQAVCANGLSSLLGQVCDLEGVLITPGSIPEHHLQQGMVWPGNI